MQNPALPHAPPPKRRKVSAAGKIFFYLEVRTYKFMRPHEGTCHAVPVCELELLQCAKKQKIKN